ncbi:glycoside hydrolase family 30 beta sandwich domain-containing protein [Kribbella sp. NPDC056345]|uniref:glycoside hydrolase family 30 protein n=1 Tax=Kribbella sp. NPDC056345 TaxID=3345789 RepID=UPI0035D5E31F
MSRSVRPVAAAVALAVLLPGAPPAQAATSSEVWLTTADGSRLLARQADVAFGSATSGTTIDVNAGTTYQTMDGFGAAFTDSSTWLTWNRQNSSQRDAMLTKLFDRTNGIGLSLMRLPIGASDFTANSADYTFDDTCCDLNDFSINHDKAFTIPVIKAAKAKNSSLKIMASPWTPPAWMKTNNSLYGGSLRTDRHGVFADYYVKYLQAYAAEGLPIYSLAIQNEPHHEAAYESMRMAAGQQADVIKNHLGPKLAANGLTPKLVAWDHNWNEASYATTVLNDAGAKQYLAGSAFHCYGGDVSAQTAVHNAHPDRDIWFTECSGGEWATNFGDNLKWNLQNLIIGGTRNWAKGVLFWNLALDQNHGPTNGGCTNCRGVVTINNGTGNVAYNVEYYALGHASKFVVPGARRISSTNVAGSVETVAFRNPDNSIALIALNPSGSARTFTVRYAGQSFNYTLPAGAVTTFKWAG